MTMAMLRPTSGRMPEAKTMAVATPEPKVSAHKRGRIRTTESMRDERASARSRGRRRRRRFHLSPLAVHAHDEMREARWARAARRAVGRARLADRSLRIRRAWGGCAARRRALAAASIACGRRFRACRERDQNRHEEAENEGFRHPITFREDVATPKAERARRPHACRARLGFGRACARTRTHRTAPRSLRATA